MLCELVVQEKVEQSETMMLKFSLSWTRGPPKHRLVSELETALDLQRIRNGGWTAQEGKREGREGIIMMGKFACRCLVYCIQKCLYLWMCSCF